MLAAERDLIPLRDLPPSPGSPAGTTKESLQQFVRDPLLYISRWYHAGRCSTSMEEDVTAHSQSESEEEQVNSSLESPVGFHGGAESCKSSLRAGTASIVLLRRGEGGVSFINLPVGVHLHLFSYLDVTSLCRLSQSCSYLHSLTSDHLLWTALLRRDLHRWRVVGHLSLPAVYQEASSDLTPKEIYANCYRKRCALPQQSFTHPITGRLRSLVRRIQGHVPRVVMFGSGLESVPLVRTLLWEESSPYRPVGLYPGKDGVGSGVCIQHRNSLVNLITLYTATRAERQAAAAGKRGRVNKLVSSYDDSEDGPELTQAVQEVCEGADAFILVADPTKMDSEELELNLTMLSAMLRSGSRHTPLLVLSCLMDTASLSSTLSPAQVAEQLKLCDLTHCWQVRSLDIATFKGIQDGFDWLLGASSA